MTVVVQILAVWVTLSVLTLLAFDRVKHAVTERSRR